MTILVNLAYDYYSIGQEFIHDARTGKIIDELLELTPNAIVESFKDKDFTENDIRAIFYAYSVQEDYTTKAHYPSIAKAMRLAPLIICTNILLNKNLAGKEEMERIVDTYLDRLVGKTTWDLKERYESLGAYIDCMNYFLEKLKEKG